MREERRFLCISVYRRVVGSMAGYRSKADQTVTREAFPMSIWRQHCVALCAISIMLPGLDPVLFAGRCESRPFQSLLPPLSPMPTQSRQGPILSRSQSIHLQPYRMSFIPGEAYISSCRFPFLKRYSIALKSFLLRPMFFSNSCLHHRSVSVKLLLEKALIYLANFSKCILVSLRTLLAY